MYEVFPIFAGAILGFLVPKFASSENRNKILAVLGVAVAALATIIASEEWFFIFIDLAEVFLAMGVVIKIVEYFDNRNKLRLP